MIQPQIFLNIEYLDPDFPSQNILQIILLKAVLHIIISMFWQLYKIRRSLGDKYVMFALQPNTCQFNSHNEEGKTQSLASSGARI
jgi:hypothetical protein